MRRTSIAVTMLTAAMSIAGCGSHRAMPTAPAMAQPPDLIGPEATVQAFAWSWSHRNSAELAQVLSDDFRFVFSTGDSAGNAYRDRPLGRPDLLAMSDSLFRSGAQVVLFLDHNLQALDDTRPGHNPSWHRQILTNVDLTVTVNLQPYHVVGQALFYLVRADSARIPGDLGDPQVIARDTTRWFIDEWDDLTLGNTGGLPRSKTQPAHSGPSPSERLWHSAVHDATTWGQILSLYR